MGKKYIIELLDDCPSEFKGIIVFGLTPEGQISAEPIPVEDLTPYTEPDTEQVRKEAYEKGLSDAWEAARKICTNWVLPDSVLSEIFGMNKTIDDIMKENTASEAIEKIRQYEQEKEEDGLRQNIQTIVDQCGYSLDEIAEVLQKMKES